MCADVTCEVVHCILHVSVALSVHEPDASKVGVIEVEELMLCNLAGAVSEARSAPHTLVSGDAACECGLACACCPNQPDMVDVQKLPGSGRHSRKVWRCLAVLYH